VVEQLPVVVVRVVLATLFSALAGAIDKIATARPATKSDEAFMAISFQIPGRQMPSRRGRLCGSDQNTKIE
jgi:hypothetical protein